MQDLKLKGASVLGKESGGVKAACSGSMAKS